MISWDLLLRKKANPPTLYKVSGLSVEVKKFLAKMSRGIKYHAHGRLSDERKDERRRSGMLISRMIRECP